MKGIPKLKVAAPKGASKRKPGPSHPHFKRPKMSVMGKSAYGGAGPMAFPATAAGPGDPAMMGGGPGPAPGPDAPMPPNAAPNNIGGM